MSGLNLIAVAAGGARSEHLQHAAILSLSHRCCYPLPVTHSSVTGARGGLSQQVGYPALQTLARCLHFSSTVSGSHLTASASVKDDLADELEVLPRYVQCIQLHTLMISHSAFVCIRALAIAS